jgi:hypothetical protein
MSIRQHTSTYAEPSQSLHCAAARESGEGAGALLLLYASVFVLLYSSMKYESTNTDAAAGESGEGAGALLLLRQYLYFCTSKASKAST